MRLPAARVARALSVLALGLLIARAAAVAWVCDDAFITFRSVDHVLAGHGPRWNGADRVQAYTHPLWMTTLAAATAVTRDPYRTSMVLGLLATALAAVVLARSVARTPWHAAAALGLLALSPSVADYATSGLENPLIHAWLMLFWARFFAPDAPGGRAVRARDLCLVAGLAACTRLDTLVILLPALAWTLHRTPRREAQSAVAWGAAPLVAWHLFALVYYGTLLPTSALAKLSHGFDLAALVPKGLDTLVGSWLRDPVSLLAIAVALATAALRGTPRVRAAAAGIALHLVMIVCIGGDFMSGRFLSACTWTAAALWARVVWQPRAAWVAGCAALAAALAAPGSPLRPIPNAGPRLERMIDSRGIADERRFYAALTGWRQGRGRRVWPDPATHAMVAEARQTWLFDPFVDLLRAVEIVPASDSIPAEAVDAVAAGRVRPLVLVPAVGTYGWYAGDALHVVDLYGLGDPLLSRLPAVRPDPLLGRFTPRLAALEWRQGHFLRRLPQGYAATLLTGENQIQDADLARYWDDLVLATRAPLLTPGRAGAIARIARGPFDPRLRRARARMASGDAR